LNDIVVVPTAAIQRGPNGTFVYVVRTDDTVTVRQVKVKQQNDQEAAVDEGLKSGEIVVTSGFGRLREGEHVIVDRPDSPGPVGAGKGGKGKGKGKRVSIE
jgi:multidrug efflux system membrane fusion protein